MSNHESVGFGDRYDAQLVRGGGVHAGIGFDGHFLVECYRPDGSLRWRDTIGNRVVLEGLSHALSVLINEGTSQLGPWNLGLTDSAPTTAAGDTMSSHAGWAEVTAYDESTREEFVDGAESGQSIDNSASVAEFTMNATGTAGGAFASSDNTKGGTSGTLLSVGAFTQGDKGFDSGDIIRVTYTIASSDV